MTVRTPFKFLLLLSASALLAACGGGGGSGNDSGFNPPGINISSSPASSSINTRSAITVTARVTQVGGAAIADGTTVTATVSPVGAGNISAVGTGENGQTATGTTSGGEAEFVFQSGAQPGTATIRFSAVDPNTSRNVDDTTTLTINEGPGNDPRIGFQPTKTQIPVNIQGIPIFVGSPYISEVVVNVRSASGQALTDEDDGEQAVQFSVSPVERGAVSVPDNPETEDINEFSTPWISIFTGPSAGVARAFVWSGTEPGILTLHAEFTDPDTGQRVEGTYDFEIVSNVPNVPASVSISQPTSPIYVRNAGGNSAGTFEVFVADGSGNAVPDPQEFNNVLVEIVAGEGDATLSATDVDGQVQEGDSVVVATTEGVANPLLRGGDEPGTYTIRATADRADNNVDNGIQDPVSNTIGIAVGDGRLFAIELTVPGDDALFENLVFEPDPDDEDAVSIPDGTYSVTVTALATDRVGNPVIEGTVIQFGLIDEPQTGFPGGTAGFDISGGDGNPQENGTLFTAPSGAFTTAGGGAGPGDTLVLFAEEITGNRDHEASRRVSSVNSATSLNVQRRFNRNDDTGSIVDSGPVIPYVVGRATDATIPASATTDELGVATTRYTYTVEQLGKPVIIWAQGEGEVVGGQPDTVADVEIFNFYGLAPGSLVAGPNPIPGNQDVEVTVCLFDANTNPIQGVPIGFQFAGLGTGTGVADGQSGSGTLADTTGADGCTIAQVSTSGVPVSTGEEGPRIIFSAGSLTATVDIVVNAALLQVFPTNVGVPVEGAQVAITLRLLDDSGNGVSGVPITVDCSASGSATLDVLVEPGSTNSTGRSFPQIRACDFVEGDNGVCTFTAATGQSGQTSFFGTGGPGTSPPYGGCP